jgi:hypothetical protein
MNDHVKDNITFLASLISMPRRLKLTMDDVCYRLRTYFNSHDDLRVVQRLLSPVD